MMITNYVFFALLMGGVQAFLPASVPRNQRSRSWHRPSTIASETSPSTDSERTLQSVSFQGFQGKEEEEEEIPSRLVLQDGSLRLHSAHSGPQDFLNGLNPDEWSATRATEGDESSLFLHTSHAQNLAEHESTLGELLACRRLLACSRVTRYWMGPRAGTSAEDIPFDSQFVLIEVEPDKQYALLLPLVDNGFRATLHYDADRIQVICAAESGDAAVKSTGMRALYVGTGSDPYQVIRRGFQQVAAATGTFETLENKKLPPSVDGFGWCTWDAFYSKVTPEGVLDGVQALKQAGVPPRTVILDDGWQQVTPKPPQSEPVVKEVTSKREGVSEAALSVVTKGVEKFYENYVRKAQHGTMGNKIWRLLSRTVLKAQLWNFFDNETDFNRQLSGFPANPKFEGEGKSLKSLVTELKGELGVTQVYCWHALHGYWRGVSEELGRKVGINVTNVHPNPSEHLLRLEPQLAWDTVSLFGVGLLSTKADLAKFYEYLHTPLLEAGVDGVKVDVQSGVSAVGGGVGGGPHLAQLYTNAMEDSVSKRFVAENGAANCINCMCHSTENLYRYKSTAVARASDDFYPDRPDSHTVHLVNVAYNSLFIGEICLPDWDMFHSLHESAGLHAAARAVGGCPVYVSDAPGKHDPELLRKLVLRDGSVLRAKQPGRPTRDCLFVDVTSDGESALKVWNQNACGGVVGAFHAQGVRWNYDTHENEVVNASPKPLTAVVKPHDVETLRSHKGPFAAWRHRSAKLEFLPRGDSNMEAPLDHREWEIFTIAPVQISGNLMWAPVGLVNMYNSGGALISSGDLEQASAGGPIRAHLKCRGPGRFVAFANVAPQRVILNGDLALSFSHDKESNELSLDLPEELAPGSEHHITVEWD